MADPGVATVDLSLPEPAAAAALFSAATTAGFFYVAHHDVDDGLAARYLDYVRRLFELPAAQKAAMPRSPGYGYTGPSITLDPATQSCPDLREQWKVGRRGYDADYAAMLAAGALAPAPIDGDLDTPPDDGPGWPDEEALPGFRAVVSEYFRGMCRLARRLLRLIALALDLPAAYFEAPGHFDRPCSLLSCNHYFAEPSRPEVGRLGCGAHSDYGMLTILLVDDVPGLQICPDADQPEGERRWTNVLPQPGCFIVNVGDMLQRWSNDRLRSTLHRVVNTSGRERLSSAFFFEPNPDCEVRCLPTCGGGGPGQPPARHPPVLYGHWLHRKFTLTGEIVEGAAADEPTP